MAEAQITRRGSGLVEVALAAGLSGAFVVLAVAITPLAATAVVLPASIAAGRWRSHTLPARTPHSLSVPVYSATAVVHAPRASATTSASTTDESVITAA